MSRRRRKRIALVVIAGAVLTLVVAGAAGVSQYQKRRVLARAYEQGMAAYRAGDYSTAIEQLWYYSNRRPGNPDVLYALADSRRRVPLDNERHIEYAISLAKNAADTAVDKLPALELLLELYTQLSWATELLEAADKVLAIDGRHAAALRARVRAQVTLNRLEQALVTAHRLVDVAPRDVSAHRNVVSIMAGLQRPRPDIMAYADALVERLPGDVDAAVLQIDVADALGGRQRAIDLARAAAGLPLETPEAVTSLLTVLDRLGLAPEAQALLQRATSDERLRTRVALGAAERAWKSGRPAEARAHLERAGDTENDDEAAGWMAFLDTELDPDADTPAVTRVRQGATPALLFWRDMLAAQAAFGRGDLPGASEALRTAAATRPGDPVAEYLRGRADDAVGEWAMAAARWEQVVAADPGFRIARLALVSTLIRNGRFAEARDHARRGLAARPDLVEIYAFAHATVAALESRTATAGAVALGDAQQILTILEDFIEQPGMRGSVLPLLARAYLATGRLADAEATTRKMMQEGVQAGAEDVLVLIAAWESRNPALADELLQAARGASPNDSDLLFAAAVREAAAGRPEAGAQMLRRAAEQAGDDAVVPRLQLAIYLDRIGDPAAGDMLTRLATDHPRVARVQQALLESQSAWADGNAIAAAVSRLRAISGEASQVWRVAEARRLLVFERTPAQAARVVQLLADVIRVNPDDPRAIALMADAMILLDDRTKAVDLLGRLVDGGHRAAGVYPILIALLREAGRLEEAGTRLREFQRMDKLPADLRRQRGQLLAAHGMLNEAQAEFESLAAAGAEEDRLNLARLLVRRGQHDAAAAVLEDLLKATSPGPQVLISAAEFQGLRGNVDAGLALLERLPANDQAIERELLTASYLERHGRLAEAERLYRRRAESGPPRAWTDLSRFLTMRGRFDEAESVLRQALAKHPGEASLRSAQELVRVLRGQNVPGAALSGVAEMLMFEGSDSVRQRFIETLAANEANPADRAGAVARLRRFTEQHPTFYPGWYMLVVTLTEHGNFADAARSGRVAARFLSTDPRAARLAVDALTRAGEHADALEMAHQWRENTVEGSAAVIQADAAIALLLGRLGRPQDGLTTLSKWADRIQEEADTSPDRLELLARLHAQTGNHAEAHRLLWDRAQASRDLAFAYLRTAEQLAAGPEIRLQWLRRVEPLLANDSEGRFALARAWHILAAETSDGDALAHVLTLLGEAPDALPDPGRAALLLAQTHEQRGDLLAAIQFYRQALKHIPDDPIALNNLAYLLVTTTPPTPQGAADEALGMARRAVEIANRGAFPEQVRASFLDTLGVIQLKLGRFDHAEQSFRDGLLLHPRGPALLVGLAEAQFARGDQTGANNTVTRLSELVTGEGGQLADTILERLNALKTKLGDQSDGS